MDWNTGYFLFGLLLGGVGTLSLAKSDLEITFGLSLTLVFAFCSGLWSAAFLVIPGILLVFIGNKRVSKDMKKRKKTSLKPSKALVETKVQISEGLREGYQKGLEQVQIKSVVEREEDWIEKSQTENPFRKSILKIEP